MEKTPKLLILCPDCHVQTDIMTGPRNVYIDTNSQGGWAKIIFVCPACASCQWEIELARNGCYHSRCDCEITQEVGQDDNMRNMRQ